MLGDLLESLAGAIFVDSGMDLEAVWRIFVKVFESKIGELQLEQCCRAGAHEVMASLSFLCR